MQLRVGRRYHACSAFAVSSLVLLLGTGCGTSTGDPVRRPSDKTDLDAHFSSRLTPGALAHYANALTSDAPASVQVLVRSEAPQQAVERVRQLGGRTSTVTRRGIAAELPALGLLDLASDPSVDLIWAPHPLAPVLDDLDDSIKDTKTDRVHAGTGLPLALKGTGVVVGIVDLLGDFTHPDFTNSDGTTRIKFFWDQRLIPTTGESSPAEFGTGVEYTAADLNDDLMNPSLPNRVRNAPTDRHGTNVSAFAVSTGRAPGSYVGIAPDADVIWVNRRASTMPSGTAVVEGVDYVFKRAQSLGEPAVVNISSGLFNVGPHDGTWPMSTMLDDLTGPGRLITVSAGNEGGNDTHASDSLTGAGNEDTVTVNVTAGSNNVQLDFWYDGDDQFEAFVVTPNNTTHGPFAIGASCPGSGCIADADDGYINVNHRQDAVNGDNEISFLASSTDFSGGGGSPLPFSTGTWSVRLRAVSVAGSAIWHGWSTGQPFTSFVDPSMTLHEPSMAKNVIAVAAHRSRTEFLAADGITYNVFSGDDDGIWPGSSQGPSRKPSVSGFKPELSAPGSAVVSAMSSKNPAVSASNQSPDQQHNLVFGTSYSAPHVAGALALALQANPTLMPDEADALLTGSACPDADTCEDDAVTTPIAGLPNGVWGFGKLDAYALVKVPVMGFPTKEADDGKFVTVTGQPFATLQNQRTEFLIGVPAGQRALTVTVFDGDQATGSLYDTDEIANPAPSGAKTCYDLYSSIDKVNKETTGAQVSVTSATLPDADWGLIYTGPTFGTASGSGAHFYILDVYLTLGSCGQPVVTVSAGLTNTFKVRATGQVSTVANDFSFIARDLSGPFAVGPLADTAMPDTTYNGEFRFFIAVESASQNMILRDADADILVDDDPAVVGQRGPADVKSDGVATGRSALTQYELFEPDGVSNFLNTNPSGNNDGINVLDTEEISRTVAGKPGSWEWRWRGVFVQNNVRIWAPFGSPSTFEVFAEPMKRLSPSGAQPRAYWITADLAPWLPQTLGESPSELRVADPATAQAILQEAYPPTGGSDGRKVGVCHLQPDSPSGVKFIQVGTNALNAHLAHGDFLTGPMVLAELAAELLAAKLNIAAAAARGEDLASAFVYSRTVSVQDTVDAADAALGLGQAACEWSEAALAERRALIVLLRAINQAEVTFAQPDFAAFESGRTLGPDGAAGSKLGM